MPHGIDSPLTLDSQGAPAAKGTVDPNEPMSWIAFWIWQEPGLDDYGRAAATGRASYDPPQKADWSVPTNLVGGSPKFKAGKKARAMALARVERAGEQEFYWWERYNIDIQ
jgi:hypothetical protein